MVGPGVEGLSRPKNARKSDAEEEEGNVAGGGD